MFRISRLTLPLLRRSSDSRRLRTWRSCVEISGTGKARILRVTSKIRASVPIGDLEGGEYIKISLHCGGVVCLAAGCPDRTPERRHIATCIVVDGLTNPRITQLSVLRVTPAGDPKFLQHHVSYFYVFQVIPCINARNLSPRYQRARKNGTGRSSSGTYPVQ